MAWVTDAPTGNLDNLEIISEDDFDENLQLPTYVYLNVWIRGKEIRLGIDTGSVRTLLSEEVFNILNYFTYFIHYVIRERHCQWFNYIVYLFNKLFTT